MASYDSDESLSDEEAGVSTTVLLGYASKEPTGDAFSQLGGQPRWLDASQHPPPSLAQCKSCSGYMSLLLQLNGDLPERFPGHERQLYLWGCRRKACRRKEGSMRALRGLRIDPKATKQKKPMVAAGSLSSEDKQDKQDKQALWASMFGATPRNIAQPGPHSPDSSIMNPFAPPAPAAPSTNNTANSENLPATFAEKARISSTPLPTQTQTPAAATPWPEPASLPAPYPVYHLDADYEYLYTPPSPAATASSHYKAFLDNDDDSGQSQSTNSSAAADRDAALAESAHDKAFQHFADRVAQNPEQVLRYEFAGQPLMYSRTDGVGALFTGGPAAAADAKVRTSASASMGKGKGMPRCAACGADRVFELQLTPHAIAELEAEEDVAAAVGEGMEWGTVILGVCERDCGGAGGEGNGEGEGQVTYMEEWVGVQWEEVVKRGR